MSYGPIRCKFNVGRLSVEVDLSKWDCNRESAHCHVCANGYRVGQVWLDSITFESGPSELSFREVNNVLRAIADHRYELNNAYENNRKYGSD